MAGLFELDAAPAPEVDIPPPTYSHRERVAWRKLGSPEHFHFFAWECIRGTDAVKVTGCVVTRRVTKGPRKGELAYDEPHRVAVVTDPEVAEERARYIAETGNCGECLGTAQVFHRWDHLTGTEYRPCSRCGATGRADLGTETPRG